MNLFKLITVLCFAFCLNSANAQIYEIGDQELLLRKWKTYGITPYNDDLTKFWLSIFDKKNYSSYEKNEFKLRDKIEQTNTDLYSRLENMQEKVIYFAKTSKSFGEYDFGNEKFIFKPFGSNSSYKISTPDRYIYSFSEYLKLMNAELIINNLNFIDGIPMQKKQAEEFLVNNTKKNIWGQNFIDRTVYLKIYYYNSIDDKFEMNTKESEKQTIKGSALMVQAFGDKEYYNFICEWWNPFISDYYKQQLITNNIPRGFYESLSQHADNLQAETENSNTDRDGDGVMDVDDKCPDVSGPASNKGCPVVKDEVKNRIVFSSRSIQFETGKSIIKPVSYKILDEVASILNQYQYYNLDIDGHTDNTEAYNADAAQSLSQSRSINAMEYLINKGVTTDRLTAFGYGATKPIADNKTAAGRAQNRRVEFNLIFK
jgi:outer membrane protein OmpA-like peptidoglycan-associated protein